jgi:F-type H+-transporting ATPase subunit b
MNINITLFGQMITFAIFVWFTLTYVWPPIMQALEEREAKIAAGIQEAEQARLTLQAAKEEKAALLADAQRMVDSLIQEAKSKANLILSEAKTHSLKQHDHIIALAEKETQAATAQARQALLQEVADYAIIGSEKILHTTLDKKACKQLVDTLIAEEQSHG